MFPCTSMSRVSCSVNRRNDGWQQHPSENFRNFLRFLKFLNAGDPCSVSSVTGDGLELHTQRRRDFYQVGDKFTVKFAVKFLIVFENLL